MKRWVLRHGRTDYERESVLPRWEEVELIPVEWCVSGAKDLRLIGREFQKRGCEMIDRQT